MTDKRLVCEVGEFVGRGEVVRRERTGERCHEAVWAASAGSGGEATWIGRRLIAALGGDEMEGSRIYEQQGEEGAASWRYVRLKGGSCRYQSK